MMLKSLIMKIFRYLLLIVSLFCISNAYSQKKELMTEKDGFSWYSIGENSHYGAQDIEGNNIIPLSRGYDYPCIYITTYDGWFKVSKNGKNGVCDKNGKELLKPKKYDDVSFSKIGDSLNGSYVFEVAIKDQYGHLKHGVCNKNGKEFIPLKYDYILGTIANCYIVKLNGLHGILDSLGKEIIPIQYRRITSFNDKYFKIDKNFANGLMDTKGKLIIPAEYRDIQRWDNSSPYIKVTTFDNHCGVYSTNGDTIIPPFYSSIDRNTSDYRKKKGFWVKNDEGYYGFYDESGGLIIPTSLLIDNISKYNNYCIVSSGINQGVIDSLGSFIIPLGEYTSVLKQLPNGCFFARKDGKIHILDNNGNVKFTTKYRNIQYDKEKDDYFEIKGKTELFKKDNNTYYKVYDDLGRIGVEYANKLIIDCDYDNIIYKNGYFYVNKNGFWGINDESGNIIIPADTYHDISYIKDGYSYTKVRKNTKWGAVSFDGKVIIEPDKYTTIGAKEDNNGLIYVERGPYCGKCDLNGNIVIAPQYTRISTFKKSITKKEYIIEKGNMVGLCDASGKVLIHPIYNDIMLDYDASNKDFQYYKVYSGKYNGLYSIDGKLLFPADQFTYVNITNNKITAFDSDDWRYEFSLDGQLIYDGQANYKSKQYNKFFDDAGDYFNKGKYKKALGCYKKALAYKQNATVYFNIGASYYNLGKYYDAIKYYEICLDHEPSLALADKAKNSINKARKNIQIKEIRRQEAIQAAIGSVIGVTTAILQANNPAYNNDSYYNPYSNNNYLLDPNYAMWQTEQQNQLEYAEFSRTWKKPDGSNYTYQEFLGIKAQSLAGYQQQNNNGSSVSDSNISQSSTQTNTPSANKPCPRCNGKGRIVYDTYPPMFGLQDSKVKCNECGEYHLKSTGHTHITCPLCHGKGHN